MVTKLKGPKTARAPAPKDQGKFRWSFEYKNGKVCDKYNEDGSKNVYAGRGEDGKAKCHVSTKDVKAIALTNYKGDVVAVMDVPDGAVVFQRRRVRDINYYNRFHDVTTMHPESVIDGRYYPAYPVTHRYPEYTYGEMWLIGWRKREVDGSVSMRVKAVYPDGKVEDFTGWDVKPWMKEPELFDDECLDDQDRERQAKFRLARGEHTVKEFKLQYGNK